MKKRKLDISNYEAWMLDRMEGQLSAEEEVQLQDFLAAHPELDEDLDSYAEISLTPVGLEHPDKESLKMPEEQDHALISALESGSDGLEFSKQDLEEFKRYQKTILAADERIVFPDKESLKKEVSTPIIPMWLGRLAIAASLIGIVLTIFFQTRSETYEPRLTQSALPVIDLEFPEGQYENLAEQENTQAPEDASPVIDQSMENLALEENQTPREITPEPNYTPQESPRINLAQTPEIQSEDIELKSPELDIPEVDIAENPSLEENSNPFVEDEFIAEVPIEEDEQVAEVTVPEVQPNEKASESNTTEISSVLDLLKRATRDSDLLALQDANEESAYVETSLKVGRFKLDVKRRKRN